MIRRDVGDIVLEASRTGVPIADAIMADAFKNVRPVIERPIRPQFVGNCPTCGDRYFGCPCEDEKPCKISEGEK